MNTKNNIYEKIVENLNDGLIFVDQNKIITYWNSAAEKITGYSSDEIVGKSCSENIISYYDLENKAVNISPIEMTITDGIAREADLYIVHKNGSKIAVSIRVSTIKGNSKEVIGAIELFTDNIVKSANEKRIRELEKMALIDNLTKLANRHYIEKELKGRFEEKKRFNVPFGILFADIDDFKNFNDKYGHITGDEVLKKVSEIFITNSRPFDLFGRWGGEEFIGIIRNINRENLVALGEKMRNLVEETVVSSKTEKLNVTISIGATMVQADDTVTSLVERADCLLYKSKKNGKNRLTSDSHEY